MLYEIIELIRAPYKMVKRQAEDSIVGQSEWDRSNIRFWKWFAWIFTAVVIGFSTVGWLAWKFLTP